MQKDIPEQPAKLSTLYLKIFTGSIISMVFFYAPFFKYQLPYMPTTNTKTKTVFKLLERHQKLPAKMRFIDLGSGDGRIVLSAAKHFGNISFIQCVGIERNTSLYLISKMRSLFSKAEFWNQSFWDVDTRPFQVVYIFGIPDFMDQFGKKLEKQDPGSFVVTNKFPLVGWKPIDSDGEIFLYQIPKTK
jgi:hypothetical protein